MSDNPDTPSSIVNRIVFTPVNSEANWQIALRELEAKRSASFLDMLKFHGVPREYGPALAKVLHPLLPERKARGQTPRLSSEKVEWARFMYNLLTGATPAAREALAENEVRAIKSTEALNKLADALHVSYDSVRAAVKRYKTYGDKPKR